MKFKSSEEPGTLATMSYIVGIVKAYSYLAMADIDRVGYKKRVQCRKQYFGDLMAQFGHLQLFRWCFKKDGYVS